MAASVCVLLAGWTSFQLADVMAFWNQRSGTLCEAEITSSLLVMEDTRKMIRQQDCTSAILFLKA